MRAVILTSKTIDEFQHSVINKLISSKHIIIGWIIDDKKPASYFKKVKSNFKKGRGGYILIMALRKLFKRDELHIDISQLMQQSNAPVHYTTNLNSIESIDEIIAMNADVLILIGGFGIIGEKILNLCKYGIVSYHHGNMQKYRGQPPGFWELYNNESEMGVTVQKLAAGLDCGEPIMELSIPIRPKDTLHSLQKRFYSQSVVLLVDALNFLEEKKPVLGKFDNYGKIYTLPNLRQWLYFNMKIFFRRLRNDKLWLLLLMLWKYPIFKNNS